MQRTCFHAECPTTVPAPPLHPDVLENVKQVVGYVCGCGGCIGINGGGRPAMTSKKTVFELFVVLGEAMVDSGQGVGHDWPRSGCAPEALGGIVGERRRGRGGIQIVLFLGADPPATCLGCRHSLSHGPELELLPVQGQHFRAHGLRPVALRGLLRHAAVDTRGPCRDQQGFAGRRDADGHPCYGVRWGCPLSELRVGQVLQ